VLWEKHALPPRSRDASRPARPTVIRAAGAAGRRAVVGRRPAENRAASPPPEPGSARPFSRPHASCPTGFGYPPPPPTPTPQRKTSADKPAWPQRPPPRTVRERGRQRQWLRGAAVGQRGICEPRVQPSVQQRIIYDGKRTVHDDQIDPESVLHLVTPMRDGLSHNSMTGEDDKARRHTSTCAPPLPPSLARPCAAHGPAAAPCPATAAPLRAPRCPPPVVTSAVSFRSLSTSSAGGDPLLQPAVQVSMLPSLPHLEALWSRGGQRVGPVRRLRLARLHLPWARGCGRAGCLLCTQSSLKYKMDSFHETCDSFCWQSLKE
jgi:hypothetical protein